MVNGDHSEGPPSLPLLTTPSPSTGDRDSMNQQAMSGKRMYSFTSKAQMSKKGLTPRIRSKNDDSSRGKDIAVCSGGGVTDEKEVENVSDKDSSEEEMEVDKNETEAVPVRVTRHRSKKVVSESESESSESSEDEDLIRVATQLNKGEVLSRTDENTLDDYFTAHSGRAGVTSDHTLAKLSCPKMDKHSVQNALEATSSNYQKDCQALYKEYTNLYPYWLHLMQNGFNILLYGLGSKQQLLEDFRKKHLHDSCHVVVNGFFPGLTVKQILNTLSSELLGHTGSFKSLVEQATFICKELEDNIASPDEGSPKNLFLIIHNIDGAMLRGEAAQNVLSVLAHSPAVHILASIDHINAPLIWDERKLSKFNWMWHDVTTFEFYREETSYENSLLVQQSGSLALSSLTHVTKSLTPNARGIFELLVKYQLEHKSDKDGIYLGLSFHDCYVRCREKFLVNSDTTLRAQLTEFKDHKLVRTRKGQDGVEYLFIPIDNSTLNQFLEQKEE